ncbi:MAG TPA: hypothetical protein PK668_26550 [Myxococcota bacterium]|nr:hypothetical protein [Myxococcota bacterium]HRY97089.1 hypothetical protein [Myxococcota bacterium]
MPAERVTLRARLRRHPVLAIVGLGLLALGVWYALSGSPRRPVGAFCSSNAACRSGICLPDADSKEVDGFVELAQAYELGRRANPALVGEIDELLGKASRSSLTLRPLYPGVCTQRCSPDSGCPRGMFCAEAVWAGAIRGLDLGRLQLCVPDAHPAARLMR